MKRMTAAIAIALSAAAFEPAVAQVPNLQFQTPLNYRFSVQPKSLVFFRDRRHRHGWHHRHPRRQFLPLLAGPAVIYRNGETVPPEQTVTEPAVPWLSIRSSIASARPVPAMCSKSGLPAAKAARP